MGPVQENGDAAFQGKPLSSPHPGLLPRVSYRVLQGDRGIPQVQLDLTFSRKVPAVLNPSVAFALIIDSERLMAGPADTKHIFDAAATTMRTLQTLGAGLNLALLDTPPVLVGPIHEETSLRTVLRMDERLHPPASPPAEDEAQQAGTPGTKPKAAAQVAEQQEPPPPNPCRLTEILADTIDRFAGRRGTQIVVVCNGVFDDRDEAQTYLLHQLVPQVTAQRPYAYRVHFICVGPEPDLEFFERVQRHGTSAGISVISWQHCPQPAAVANAILDAMDRALIGITLDASLSEELPESQTSSVRRAGHITLNQWVDGQTLPVGFLPRRAMLGVEYAAPHPEVLMVGLRFHRPQNATVYSLRFRVPIPTVLREDPPPTAWEPPTPEPSPQPADPQPSTAKGFRLPWRR